MLVRRSVRSLSGVLAWALDEIAGADPEALEAVQGHGRGGEKQACG
jgi:hypothetical protein